MTNMQRRKTRKIKVGDIYIGADAPVSIQSMTKTDTRDISRTVKQIRSLESVGCQIVRVAVKDIAAAKAIKAIRPRIKIPLVADIHFEKDLAIESMRSGADKIRINPGNLRDMAGLKQIADMAKRRKIPVRIGVNSGSVRGKNCGRNTPELMAYSALGYVKSLEKMGFYDIVISLKASSVPETIQSNLLVSKECDYPLHLGVTATGLPESGAIKSSVAIGALLSQGIGDTIRVSLTSEPEKEVLVAKEILRSLNLARAGVEVISCPTCGRCQVDLCKTVSRLSERLNAVKNGLPDMKVAIMGCEVNGPGEAKDADIGIAAGAKCGMLFKKGKIIKKIKEKDFVGALIREIKKK